MIWKIIIKIQINSLVGMGIGQMDIMRLQKVHRLFLNTDHQ